MSKNRNPHKAGAQDALDGNENANRPSRQNGLLDAILTSRRDQAQAAEDNRQYDKGLKYGRSLKR